MIEISLTIEPTKIQEVKVIQMYAADERIAATTHIPHPLPSDYVSSMVKREIEGWLTNTRYSFSAYYHQNFAGICTLSNVSHTLPVAELSYWVAIPFWGKGIASETVRQVVEFAWRKLFIKKLLSGVLIRNPASRRVLEKNGFHLVRIIRNNEEYGKKFMGEERWIMELIK